MTDHPPLPPAAPAAPQPSSAATAAGPDPVADRLLDLLRLCNDWLKFAETKNVGIVGLAGSSLTFIIVALGFLQTEGLTTGPGVALTGGGLLLALSLLAGVWSFQPATSIPAWMRPHRDSPHQDDNLFYFGHAAKYAPRALAEAIARRYERQAAPDLWELHDDLAAQLIVNARITLQKLKLFRWAVVLFGVGALLAAGGMLAVLVMPGAQAPPANAAATPVVEIVVTVRAE